MIGLDCGIDQANIPLWQRAGAWPFLTYNTQPPVIPAWSMMMLLAPPTGITTCALMLCDLFLTSRALSSLSERMPGYSASRWPMKRGRPVMSVARSSGRRAAGR